MDPSQQVFFDRDLFLFKEVPQNLTKAKGQEVRGAAKDHKCRFLVNYNRNQVRSDARDLWRSEDVCVMNPNIPGRSYPLLSLRDQPFSVKEKQVLIDESVYGGMHWAKDLLLYKPDLA